MPRCLLLMYHAAAPPARRPKTPKTTPSATAVAWDLLDEPEGSVTGLVPLPPPPPPDLSVDEGDDPPRVPVEPPAVPEGDWPEPVPVAVGPGIVFDVGLVTAAGGVYVLRNDSLDASNRSRLALTGADCANPAEYQTCPNQMNGSPSGLYIPKPNKTSEPNATAKWSRRGPTSVRASTALQTMGF